MIKMNKPPETNKLNANAVGADALVDPNVKEKPHANVVGAGLVSAQRGITLIALIITIIILLILAGVTINLLIGENGLFSISKQAGKDYIKSQLKEELEIEIAHIQARKISEGKEFIRDNLKELASIGATVESTGIPTEGEYKNYYFEVDENYVVTILDKLEEEISEAKVQVNAPKVAGTGLIPVTINADGSLNTINETNKDWYNYVDTSVTGKANTSKWANAKTKDGSLWVWIPRYAYKITYTNPNDKSQGGTIDVVFLKDDTNKDFRGNDVTSANYVDEKGNIGAYIVHPSFRDGTSNGFANGEWNKEITGFWMAKFEAGYAGIANNPNSVQDSSVRLSTIYDWNGSTATNVTTNYYGSRTVGNKIKYPVFMASRPSMNYLGISDSFDLCQKLTETNNPYGFTTKVDSHLTKNSEWGAVAYLTHSKYGTNGQEVRINNVNANGENTIYAVTGYGASADDATEDKSRSLEILTTGNATGSWTTSQGQTASSTKNIYGVYDLSGGLWEWTAGYVAPTSGSYIDYGGRLKENSTNSNQYKSKYAGISGTNTDNYNEVANKARKGEAKWETSISGAGSTSWNSDYSHFVTLYRPFVLNGGNYGYASGAGVFAFGNSYGACYNTVGFRPILICE